MLWDRKLQQLQLCDSSIDICHNYITVGDWTARGHLLQWHHNGRFSGVGVNTLPHVICHTVFITAKEVVKISTTGDFVIKILFVLDHQIGKLEEPTSTHTFGTAMVALPQWEI